MVNGEEKQAVVQCVRCSSHECIKHGKAPSGKQRYQCMACGKTFVLQPDTGVDPLVEEIATNLIRLGVAAPTIYQAVRGHASRSWVYKQRREVLACR